MTEELLDEYERLFVGPGRTPCPPYESLWLDGQPRLEQGRLMGAASVAVADLYRGLGLDVAAAAHELPDHVAIELEALAFALRAEGAAAEEARAGAAARAPPELAAGALRRGRAGGAAALLRRARPRHDGLGRAARPRRARAVSLVDLLGAVDSEPERVETARGTVILLCSDLAGDGLDLGDLEGALGDRLPEVTVVVVEHLCERPAAAAPALRTAGAARAVIGVCRRRVPEAELRGRIRSGGSSSCDVDVVRVPRTRGVAAAATALAAAAARLALMPSGEPSRAVPTPGGFSRAALFRLAPAVSLLPVAAVDAERCIGVSRCGLCVEACPAHAISSRDDTATVVSSACETCGRCVPACPVGAVHIAGATRSQLQVQLAALLAGPSPAGVLFACAGAVESLDDEPALDDWAVVELPALAVATPGWVLQTLAGGAPRVHLRPCAGECCSPWREGGASLELCRALLPAALAGRVTAGARAPSARVLAGAPPVGVHRLELAEPQATTLALRSLGVDDLVVEHPAAPLGLVDVGVRLHGLQRLRDRLSDGRPRARRPGGHDRAPPRPEPVHRLRALRPRVP